MDVNPHCVLCSGVFARYKLTPEEFRQIQNVLGSLVPDVAGVLEESSPGSSAFCEDCHGVLKETARLHLLLETLNSQLNSLLVSIKSKVVGRSLEVNVEDVVEVKEEEVDFKKEHTDSDEVPDDFEDNTPFPPADDHLSDPDYSYESHLRRSRRSQRVTQNFTEESNGSTEGEQSDDEEQLSSEYEPSGAEDNSPSLPDDVGDDSQSQDSAQQTKRPKRRRRRSANATKDNNVPSTPKKPRNKDFVCSLCSLNFKQKEDKLLHDEAVHFKGAGEDVEGACVLYSRICGKSSLTPGDLSRHNETSHEASLKFLCLSCNPQRKFTTLDLLKAHQPIHDYSLTSFPCSLCPTNPVTFDTPLHLDNHILRVHNHAVIKNRRALSNRVGPDCEDPVPLRRPSAKPCGCCGFKSRQGPFGLRAHERKTHPEQFTFICTHELCRSSFLEESHRLTCQETHKDSPGPFNCFVCNFTCPSGSDLKEHLASKHTTGGIKCPKCPDRPLVSTKRFPDATSLKIHTAQHHNGEWPHKCPFCSRGFQSQSGIRDHLRAAHPNENLSIPKSVECPDCGKNFARLSGLNSHKKYVHNNFKNSKKQKNEYKSNSFVCEECGKVLKGERSISLHMKSHKGTRDHVCHICGKGFINPQTLINHLRIHTGEKSFVCHICSRAFTQPSTLYKHGVWHKKQGTWVEKPTASLSASSGPASGDS